MIYKTSMDNVTKGITVGVTILFAIIIAGQFAVIKDAGHAVPIYTTILLILIYFIAFAWRPVSYEISAEQVIVHKLFKNVKISRDLIDQVEIIGNDKIRPALRTFGVGGLFGYYGNFASFKMGAMTWYATRRNNTVLIRTKKNKKIILTPDCPEAFVKELSQDL
jgi:hypothetical protein